MKETSRVFLVVSKTQESTEAQDFKRYIGVGSTFVKGVQPTKKELDEFFGYDAQEPEYVVDTDNGKEVRITFLLQTDPEVCNGIELKSRAMFSLRATPAYNKDETKVQVIDKYGNYTWVDAQLAKSGGTLPQSAAIDQSHYRMAAYGECDLVAFLKKFLGVPNSLKYTNGVWVLTDNAEDGLFGLEHIKDYFKGDFSELKEALKLQPNNKVKLLYGIKTKDDGKQMQSVCTRGEMILRNNAGTNAIAKLEKDLASAKNAGSFSNIDYRVQELQEWDVKPTNLDKPVSDTGEMPFDAPQENPVGGSDGRLPWDN